MQQFDVKTLKSYGKYQVTVKMSKVMEVLSSKLEDFRNNFEKQLLDTMGQLRTSNLQADEKVQILENAFKISMDDLDGYRKHINSFALIESLNVCLEDQALEVVLDSPTPEVAFDPAQVSPMQCKICEEEHTSTMDLMGHLDSQHQIQGYLECPVCHVAELSDSGLLEHILELHRHYDSRGDFSCPTTGILFQREELIKFLSMTDTYLRADQPPYGQAKQNGEMEVEGEHTQPAAKDQNSFSFFRNAQAKYGCQFCIEGFEVYTHYRDHAKYRHDVTIQFKCPSCSEIQNTNFMLGKHLFTLHREPGNGPQSFKCPYTEKTFTNPELLKLHVMNTPEYFHYIHRETRQTVQCDNPVINQQLEDAII